MEDHKDKLEVNPDHGLWGFFADKKALPTPLEDSEHGMWAFNNWAEAVN